MTKYREVSSIVEAVQVPLLGFEMHPFTGWSEMPEWLESMIKKGFIRPRYNYEDDGWTFDLYDTDFDRRVNDLYLDGTARPNDYFYLTDGVVKVMSTGMFERKYEGDIPFVSHQEEEKTDE